MTEKNGASLAHRITRLVNRKSWRSGSLRRAALVWSGARPGGSLRPGGLGAPNLSERGPQVPTWGCGPTFGEWRPGQGRFAPAQSAEEVVAGWNCRLTFRHQKIAIPRHGNEFTTRPRFHQPPRQARLSGAHLLRDRRGSVCAGTRGDQRGLGEGGRDNRRVDYQPHRHQGAAESQPRASFARTWRQRRPSARWPRRALRQSRST